mgnify:CR=1 FL=1
MAYVHKKHANRKRNYDLLGDGTGCALGWIQGYTGTQGLGRMYHRRHGLGVAFRHCDGALSPWSVGWGLIFLIRKERHDGEGERER